MHPHGGIWTHRTRCGSKAELPAQNQTQHWSTSKPTYPNLKFGSNFVGPRIVASPPGVLGGRAGPLRCQTPPDTRDVILTTRPLMPARDGRPLETTVRVPKSERPRRPEEGGGRPGPEITWKSVPLEFAFKSQFACSDFDPDVSVDLPFPRLGPPQKIQIRITIWKICLPIAGAPIAQNNKATANRRAPGGHAEWGRGASGDKANRPASVLTSISSPAKD